MFNNPGYEIHITNTFLSTSKDNGKRLSIEYSYNISQFVEAVLGYPEGDSCRIFIDLLLNEEFNFSDIQIQNVCKFDRRAIYARDNDILKLVLLFLNDPRHVLIMRDVDEEDELISKLKKRFTKGAANKLVLTIQSFDSAKFDTALAYAKQKNWNDDEIEKLYKYVDTNESLLGYLEEHSYEMYDDYIRITKVYNDGHTQRTLTYNIYSDEELHKYADAHINDKGYYISDRLSDYQSVEDWCLRDVEEKDYDEIFDYEKFKSEALTIQNKYPALKSFDELYNADIDYLREYDNNLFMNFYESTDDNYAKREYVNIIRTLKSLQNHIFNECTKPVEFYNKFFVVAAKDGKIDYKTYLKVCDEIDELEW